MPVPGKNESAFELDLFQLAGDASGALRPDIPPPVTTIVLSLAVSSGREGDIDG